MAHTPHRGSVAENGPRRSQATMYSQVVEAAEEAGLIVMGVQHPRLSAAKDLQGGTLVLLGTAAQFWSTLQASPESQGNRPDPIDRWSRRVIDTIADDLGATAHYPFGGPPYAPFIDWALKSGRTFSSPVGALVHDRVGMLISFRGALHFPLEFEFPDETGPSPCVDCAAPCVTACPVQALSAEHFYDVSACHDYLDKPEGQTCLKQGCIARLACPLSAGAGRDSAQTAHHMNAFHPS